MGNDALPLHAPTYVVDLKFAITMANGPRAITKDVLARLGVRAHADPALHAVGTGDVPQQDATLSDHAGAGIKNQAAA
jgi:hypothetical protein